MKQLLAITVLFFTSLIAIAQPTTAPIAIVAPNGSTQLTDRLDSAIAKASAGATIYLPGGTFSGNVTIDKKLNIIGVGHYADSSSANNTTTFNGSIILTPNASNSVIDGLHITENFYATSQQSISDVSIYRCNFDNIITDDCENFYNFNISYSIMRGITNGKSGGVGNQERFVGFTFTSCILNSYYFYSLKTTNFYNCIFTGASGGNFSNTNFYYAGINIYNSIFLASGLDAPNDLTKGTFTKCSFSGAAPSTISSNLSNCYFNSTTSNLFVTHPNNPNPFSYGYNYHLTPSNAAGFLGNDGTQIGIYGGSYPYKDGAIPPNPHVRSRIVAPQTGANGKLRIQYSLSNN